MNRIDGQAPPHQALEIIIDIFRVSDRADQFRILGWIGRVCSLDPYLPRITCG